MPQNRLRSLALNVLTLVLLTMSFASGAYAAIGFTGGYAYEGVNIRDWKYVSSTSLGLGYSSHTACLATAEQGDTINGNPWWWYHRNQTTGVVGWSAEYYLHGSPGTQCSW